MKLSILIPAIGSQSDIDDTLVSVLENRPANCEVLLIHHPEYVDPYQLDDEIKLIACQQLDTLSLLNDGFAAASGDVIHTLCPGITVRSGWCVSALDAFADDLGLGSLSPAILTPSAPVHGIRYHAGCGKQFVCKPNRRVLAPSIHSAFYRRTAMQFMRGFDTQYGDLADVELGLRMYSANYRAMACDEVELASNAALPMPAMRGFRAGQLRGRLFQQAKSFALASSQGFALMGEPFRNGWGLGAITGLMGRLACGTSDRAETLPIRQVDDSAENREAA